MTQFGDAAWKDMEPAMWYARGKAEGIHYRMFGRQLTITSGRRPQTAGGSSKHETGEAMDIRVREPDGSWEMSHEEQRAFAAALREEMGEDFDVVVEGPAATSDRYRNRVAHVHVEYDPKGRHADG